MSSERSPGTAQGRLVFHGRGRLEVPGFSPYYRTDFGDAYLADSLAVLKALPDDCINAVVTSPPYALHFKKEYGNEDKADYVAWFLQVREGRSSGL